MSNIKREATEIEKTIYDQTPAKPDKWTDGETVYSLAGSSGDSAGGVTEAWVRDNFIPSRLMNGERPTAESMPVLMGTNNPVFTPRTAFTTVNTIPLRQNVAGAPSNFRIATITELEEPSVNVLLSCVNLQTMINYVDKVLENNGSSTTDTAGVSEEWVRDNFVSSRLGNGNRPARDTIPLTTNNNQPAFISWAEAATSSTVPRRDANGNFAVGTIPAIDFNTTNTSILNRCVSLRALRSYVDTIVPNMIDARLKELGLIDD